MTWLSFEKGASCSAAEAAYILAPRPEGAAGPAPDLAGVRGLYCYAARALPAIVVEGLAGVPIFQSGPHRDGKLQLDSVHFGRYNVAFVRWAGDHLVPGATDAAFRQTTQPIYDRHLRDLVRAYAAADQFFQKHPGELTRIVLEYKSAIEAVDHSRAPDAAHHPARRLSDAVNGVAGCVVGGDSGIEFQNAAAAAAFWVRRAMDGTRGQFSAALAKLLKTYDERYVPRTCG